MSDRAETTNERWRPPAKGTPHRPFYDELVAGGVVLRDDRLNGVLQDITLANLDGNASLICQYGYTTLSIVGARSDGA